MKFSYEKLEEIEGLFNPLLDKCNALMGNIDYELRAVLREISNSNMYTFVRWEFGDYLKSVDNISITKNGFDLTNDGLTLHMFSDEFEEGEFSFIIPYEWLDAEDNESERLARHWIRNEVNKFIELKNYKIKQSQEQTKEDLISRMKELDKDKVVELLKELPNSDEILNELAN